MFEYPSDGLKLVKIRNPWGSQRWTGKWNQNDDTWNQYPHIKQELHQDLSDDSGCF